MHTGTKTAIIALAVATLLLPGLALAAGELDSYKLWQQRISEMRAKYGEQIKCNNCIYVLLRYRPYPEGGPSWRIRDASTSAKLKQHNRSMASFDRRLGAQCPDYIPPRCTSLGKALFIRGKDFLEKHLPQEEVQKALPDKAISILKRIARQCGLYGCENQVIFMLWPEMGVVCLREPKSGTDFSLCINYYFLVPLPTAAKLQGLLR
ncbi:MAG: hypothetical protein AB1814_16130 [Thermodesulfobacteriota bacterium]